MQLKGNIRFKDAIIVDEKLLRELQEIILEFYEEVSYSVRLCNGDSIKFTDLQELLKYENIDERKIERLDIEFDIIDSLVFEPSYGGSPNVRYSVIGSYRMTDSNKSIVFSNRIINALRKNKRPKWYTMITKFSLGHVLGILLCVCLILMGYLYLKQESYESTSITTDYIVFNMMITVFVFIISDIMNKIRKHMFPIISYMIGAQIEKIQKKEKLYDNVFWGIIVASILTFVWSFVLK